MAAAAAGVLLALAFPLPGVAGLAWIAPGLLLFVAGTAESKARFRLGWCGGFAYYLTSLYWLLHIPVTFLPILGWLALAAYLALFTGSWTWLCWRFAPAEASELLNARWSQRVLWALRCAMFWVALEIVLGRFLSGFPWDFLGVSQYRMIPLIQIAEYTGVYGVSFLIIWFSASLMITGLALVQNPGKRSRWGREIALPFLVLFVLAFRGVGLVRGSPRPDDTVQVALVQPSIPQTLIWDARENATRFQQLLQLSEKALTNKPDILVWPEAALPNMLRHDRETAEAVRKLATQYHAWIILGSDDAEIRPGGHPPQDVDYFNSAFAVSPEGELAGNYRKRRLVIFGEYVPFVKWLPFLKFLSPAGDGGFTPGDKAIPFHLGSLGVTVSVLICFEDTFPHVAREYVSRTTDFLLNITNNGWFGESAAQWQHAATAVFRAIENRVPLARCANNGLSCWVDEFGAVHDAYFQDSKDIYKAGYKIVSVPILARGESRKLTFYTRYGDVFGWGCCALTAAQIAPLALRARWRKKDRPTREVEQSPGPRPPG